MLFIDPKRTFSTAMRAMFLAACTLIAACGGNADGDAPTQLPVAPITGSSSVVAGMPMNVGPAIASDNAGNLFFSSGGTVFKRSPAGHVTPVSAFNFNTPLGIAVDGTGNVFVVERGADVFGLYAPAVRRIDKEGQVSTVSGGLPGAGVTLGIGPPIAVGPDGAWYVSALGTLRKVLPDGTIVNVTAPEVRRTIDNVAVDARGNVYFGHDGMVKLIQPGQAEVALATGLQFGGGGQSVTQEFISGLAVDSAGNAYVASTRDHTIRRVSPAGVVTIVAGQPGVAGVETGPLPGKLEAPRGLALHGDKTLYVTSGGKLYRLDLP